MEPRTRARAHEDGLKLGSGLVFILTSVTGVSKEARNLRGEGKHTLAQLV